MGRGLRLTFCISRKKRAPKEVRCEKQNEVERKGSGFKGDGRKYCRRVE